MSDRETMDEAATCRNGGAFIHAWLAGHTHGRWATARGRWIQTALTAALLVTGLGAWALAIIQPWTTKATDHAIFAAAVPVNPERVRSAAVEVAELVGDPVAPVPDPLRRNPFVCTVAMVAGQGAADAGVRAASGAKTVERQPTPQEILETVKGLRLEVILITVSGQHWAVINGENYREGEVVAGLQIVEIQEGRAKLRQGDVTCLLRMD